jgi:hypothetical protein
VASNAAQTPTPLVVEEKPRLANWRSLAYLIGLSFDNPEKVSELKEIVPRTEDGRVSLTQGSVSAIIDYLKPPTLETPQES